MAETTSSNTKCSICGDFPALNISDSYWLCADCVQERLDENIELRKYKHSAQGAILRLASLVGLDKW